MEVLESHCGATVTTVILITVITRITVGLTVMRDACVYNKNGIQINITFML